MCVLVWSVEPPPPDYSDLPTAEERTKPTDFGEMASLFSRLSPFREGKTSNFTVTLLALEPVSVSTETFVPRVLIIPVNPTCGAG